MSTNGRLNFSDNENTCVVCFKTVEFFSYGVCDHPVCFECSTRMRVLCRQNECPICRQDMPKVIFTKEVEPFQAKIQSITNANLSDRRFGLIFCTANIKRAYDQILEHNCYKCAKHNRGKQFKTFAQLKDHMRREHELFYCDLCVENLKIFTFERRCYNRTELGQHRRKGDVDNTSHRGHPLCEFCDTRYMDSDELFRHLRRDHFYCHFCDADGKHEYYNAYNDLRSHFKDEHFLCEEGDCVDEQFTSVFRSDIDLKAHRASVHGRHLSKAATKQARTLELEFTLAPRPRPDITSRGGSNRKPGGPAPKQNENREEEGAVGYDTFYMEPGGPPSSVRPRTTYVNTMNSEDFPTLCGGPGGGGPLRPPSGVTITRTVRGAQALTRNNENFPALGDPSGGGTSSGTLRLSVNTNSSNANQQERSVMRVSEVMSKGPNVSIHVNHKPNGSGTITTRITNQNQNSASNSIQIHPTSVRSSEAFPALGPVTIPEAQWVSQRPVREPKPKPSKVTPAPVLPSHSSRQDFPTLSSTKISSSSTQVSNSNNNHTSNSNSSSGNSGKSVKKSSSVTVPVSNAWVNSSSGGPATEVSSTKSKNKKKKSNNNNNNNNTTTTGSSGGGSKNEKASNENVNSNSNVSTTTSASSISSSSSGSKSVAEPPPNNKNSANNSKNSRKTERAAMAVSSEGVIEMRANGDVQVPKKLSELKIDNLEISNFPTLGGKSMSASLGVKKPPPGFSCAPPPGLNHMKPLSSDLTFTNSCGQKFPILPAAGGGGGGGTENRQFHAPPNFAQRNRTLIDRFVSAANSNEKIFEFKQYSDLFRHGSLTAKSYYEHCREFLGPEFAEVFLELLVLLPDIDRQQELYSCYVSDSGNGNAKKTSAKIDVCATCKQVVLARDLKSHLSNHTLENHFPALGNPELSNSVWRK